MTKFHSKQINTLIIIAVLIVAGSFFTGNTFNNNATPIASDTLTVIKPEKNYQIENQLITSILTRYHFKEFEINDSLSNLIYNRYIDALDHGKNYFLASDIELFNKQRYQLDDDLYNGDLQFYYDVFNVYLKRLNERMTLTDSLLNTEFDYSIDEEKGISFYLYYGRVKQNITKGSENCILDY